MLTADYVNYLSLYHHKYPKCSERRGFVLKVNYFRTLVAVMTTL